MWKEVSDTHTKIELGNNMAEYGELRQRYIMDIILNVFLSLTGCLDKHSADKGKDNPLSKLPRNAGSNNKPQSLFSEDVYDKTSHRSWIMTQ